jgi:hypothetical protein
VATDEPSAPATPPTPAPGPKGRRFGGRILLVLAVVLAAVLIVGGGAAFVIYDKATAIDRSSPEVVVQQFLRAGLTDRDPARVSLFVCRQWSADEAMKKIAPPADERIFISWGDYVSTRTGDKATVDVKVQFDLGVGSVSASSVRSWRLRLENQAGWRVCDLTKSESLNP